MSWDRLAEAVLRGATRAARFDRPVHQALRSSVAREAATPVLRHTAGVDAPPSPSRLTLRELEDHAAHAWDTISLTASLDLRDMADTLARRDPTETQIVDMARRLVRELAAQDPMRRALVAAALAPGGPPLARILIPLLLFVIVFPVTAVFWAPPLYREARSHLGDPERSREARASEARLTKLLEDHETVSELLDLDPSPRLEQAHELRDQGRSALVSEDHAGARADFELACAVVRELQDEAARAERDRADRARARWARTARAFGWKRVPDANLGERRFKAAMRLDREGAPGQAALEYREAGRLFVTALRRADREPPVLSVDRPRGPTSTQAPTIRIAGRVRDASLAGVWLGDEPIEIQPGAEQGTSLFDVDLPLSRLGQQVLEIKARDHNGRESVERRMVERIPTKLLVEISQPRVGKVHGRGPVRVVGRVSAEADQVLVNGVMAKLTGRAFVAEVDLGEGEHVLSVEARGDLARGVLERALVVDRTPPRVEVISPANGAWTWAEQVLVQVRVHPDASPWVKVEVGGRPARRVVPGTLTSFLLDLEEGDTEVRVAASDAAGNVASQETRKLSRRADPPLLKPFRVGIKRYRVTRDLTIPAGKTLEIPAGAVLDLAKGVGLLCEGRLQATGSKDLPIRLRGRLWSGVEVRGPRARANLKWVVLEGAKNRRGGGLRVRNGAVVELEHSELRGCRATEVGGAVSVTGRGLLRAKNALFDRNGAVEGGGVGVGSLGRAVLLSCVLTNNRAERYGGGLVVVGERGAPAVVEATQARFEGNKAAWGAGAQVGRNGRATLDRCILRNNKSARRGGGIYVLGSGPQGIAALICRGGRLERNVAQGGGGVAVDLYATAELVGTTLMWNHARGSGGGLLALGTVDLATRVRLVKARLEANQADRDGGGLNINHFASASLRSCRLLQNEAGGWGGGLCVTGRESLATRVELIRCHFRDNRAPEDQGPDLRAGDHTDLDPKQLEEGNLVDPSRSSLARHLQPKRPDPPDLGPNLVKTNTPFGRNLHVFVERGLKGTFGDLRGVELPSTTNDRSWAATVTFEGSRSTRVWLTENGNQYASIGFGPYPATLDEAEAEYQRLVKRVRKTLQPGWKIKEVPRAGGSKNTLFEVRHGEQVLRLRVDLHVFEQRQEPRASVTLYVN